MTDNVSLHLSHAGVGGENTWGCALVRAENACDIKREGIANNGAWVQNAAACRSTEDTAREWCDITVESLEIQQQAREAMIALVQNSDNAAESASSRAIATVSNRETDFGPQSRRRQQGSAYSSAKTSPCSWLT